jgi:uncharacterized protein
VPEAERSSALLNLSGDDLPVFRPRGEFDGWYDEVEAGASWCRKCVFFPVCGGSCPKQWHEGRPACPSFKYEASALLDLIAQDAGLAVEGAEDQLREY